MDHKGIQDQEDNTMVIVETPHLHLHLHPPNCQQYSSIDSTPCLSSGRQGLIMAPKSVRQLKRKIYNALPNVLPFAVTFLHVYLSPYTKVEESFTLHAVHDVLAFGPGLKQLHLVS